MPDELVPRCDNPKCPERKAEGNGWWMGNVEVFSWGGLDASIQHYDSRYSKGKKTWCSIPCIQQVIGKALDTEIGSLSLQPCLNPDSIGATGRSESKKAEFPIK